MAMPPPTTLCTCRSLVLGVNARLFPPLLVIDLVTLMLNELKCRDGTDM